jgi:hypothetical protein
MEEPTAEGKVPGLLLLKMSMSGSLVYQKEFKDIAEIAKFLKISQKNTELIQQGNRFPKGKTRVLNKYIIKVAPEPPKNPFIVSFE